MSPASLTELQTAIAEGHSFDFLAFWGHRPRRPRTIDEACLSQWWPALFELDGVRYCSAEQFMMAEKARTMGDETARRQIMATDDPHHAKRIASQVRNFDESLWRSERLGVALRGSVAKFSSDTRLREFLVGTGPRVLVEASPHDLVWGIGVRPDDERVCDPYRWRGQNLLGFTLMRARLLLATP